MNKETLRMQMLAGVITESQYKARLNEEEGKHIYADYSESGGTPEVKFARVLADNVMAGYNRGSIDDLYSGGEWDDIRNGDPNDFYASMEESLNTFQSLPDIFTVTANGFGDEPSTFTIKKTGPSSYSATEM